jgi:NTE family protein
MPERTALILSAGAMFGAYQAGVWQALAGRFRPEVIVGASSGSLNTWAIAGGCDARQLAELWLDPAFADVTRLHVPLLPWNGVFDSDRLEALARQVHSAFCPRQELAVVVTAARGLRTRLVRNEQITWRHLAASCSVALGFRPVRIDGRLYTDGGLLGALPLWAAAELGANRAVAVLAMPRLPSAAGRAALKVIRAFASPLPRAPEDLKVLMVAPSEPMGSVSDLMFWRRENIERWLALGTKDGEAALRRL